LTVDTLDADRRRGELMAAAQAGDRSAYERLLRDCIPFIEMVARRQGVPIDRVDDVVQETLLSIHRARRTYDPSRSFTAWLRTIAQRRAIDGLRRHGRTETREIHAPLAYESYPDPAADSKGADHVDGAARVGRAVATLPARQREAVQHIAVQGLSLREAASATGRTAGALKVNLHRALKTLRAHLGGEG
jgi:RNA polymerase sigma factor (sigma-70 family)